MAQGEPHMIREFFEKRRVKKTFEKLVDPATVDSLLGGGGQAQTLKHGRIEFVLVFVRGENPAQVSQNIARVADLAVTHGARLHDFIGALVIFSFGTLPASAQQTGSRSSLVRDLREQLAYEVKIVHGAADGHHGLFGSEKFMSFTFLVPQFDRILGALSRLQFGETEEFTGRMT